MGKYDAMCGMGLLIYRKVSNYFLICPRRTPYIFVQFTKCNRCP